MISTEIPEPRKAFMSIVDSTVEGGDGEINMQENLPVTTQATSDRALGTHHTDKPLSLSLLSCFIFLFPAKLFGNSPLLLWALATGYLLLPSEAYHSVFLCKNSFFPEASS